jgi:hypothetical protein
VGDDDPHGFRTISQLEISYRHSRPSRKASRHCGVAEVRRPDARSWLVVERLSAYAPELNPVEALWSSLKAVEAANLASPCRPLAEVMGQACRGLQRIRQTPQLAYSFLRQAVLSVA